MNKTIIILFSILVTVSVFSGCGKENQLQENAEKIVETKTDVPIIEEVAIQKDKANIKYPKLINLENTNIEDKWNKIIEDRITSDLDLLTENDQYNLTYEVASSDAEEISIKLIGDCYYEGAAHPFKFIYTYNISLANGESQRLSELVDVNKLANNIYNNTGFTIETDINEEFMDYIYSAFDNEELLAEMLINFDYSEDGELPYGYSFIENGKLHLCIEVPHALGDYAIIELNNY